MASADGKSVIENHDRTRTVIATIACHSMATSRDFFDHSLSKQNPDVVSHSWGPILRAIVKAKSR